MGSSASTDNNDHNKTKKGKKSEEVDKNKRRKNKVQFVSKAQKGKNKQAINNANIKTKNGNKKPIQKWDEPKKPRPKRPIPTKPNARKKKGEPPPPRPPKLTREELLGDLDFTIIDNHALNAPNTLLLKSYWDLVKYLTEDDVWDDLWKVRSIFRWITSYNIKNLPIDVEPPANSPLEYFSKIQCDMGNYANLFCILCHLADVPCMIIDGVAKSSGYKIGEKLHKYKCKAQWNAVLIENEWFPIDLFWASTCVALNSGDAKKLAKDKKKNKENGEAEDNEDTEPPVEEIIEKPKPKSKKKKLDKKALMKIKHTEEIDECYFLTEPKNLLWTHLPDKEEWQLVKNPMSFYEFEKQVYVRERLYEIGIDIEGKHNRQCKHRTKQGKAYVDLNLPPRWAAKMQFKTNFYRSKSTAFCKEEEDVSLEHCVVWEVKGSTLQYDINIPVYGQFRLDIFARNPMIRGLKDFDLICSYIVYSPMPERVEIPLPDHPLLGWGQNKESNKIGLKPVSHKMSKLGTDSGQCEFRFKGAKNLNIDVRLKHRTVDEGSLSKYVMTRWNDGEYVINTRLPKEGYYALKIYGKTSEPGKTNIFNYLIRCKGRKIRDEPFPVMCQNMLGESVLAKNLGIRILDKDSGITTAGKGRGKLHLCPEGPVQLMYEIHTLDAKAMKRVNLMVKREHGVESVHYILPDPGEYVLTVYSYKDEDESKLYVVYTSLIHSTGSVGDSVFTPRHAIGDNEEFWNGHHDIPVETIEATDNELYLPYPENLTSDVVAYLDVNQGNGPQKNTQIEKVVVDEETLFKVTLPEVNYCAVNVYERNEGYFIKTINKYFIIAGTDGSSAFNPEDDESMLFSPTPAPSVNADEIEEKRNSYLRKKMREAEFYKDPDVLNNLIAQYEQQNPEQEDPVIKVVKNMAKKLEARQALLEAYESRNLQDVEKGIAMAQAANIDGSLDFEIMHAKRLLNRLKMIHKVRETVMEADGRAVGEGRKYANPPTPVKHSLMATLVLLGFHPLAVENWNTAQGILWKMDNDSIQNRIARFDPRMCPLEFALEAKKFLDQYTLDYMKTVSPLGTAFYVWSTQMIKEIESTAGTLGGIGEVYHDNDVQSPNYSETNTGSREPVVAGISSSTNEERQNMPPINNPPSGHMDSNINDARKPKTSTSGDSIQVQSLSEEDG